MREHLKWKFIEDRLGFSDTLIDKMLKSIKISKKKASAYQVNINLEKYKDNRV
jgi:hypothetical protein